MQMGINITNYGKSAHCLYDIKHHIVFITIYRKPVQHVRDGSESTQTKNVYKKGYPVTEVTVLTDSGHPVFALS